MRPSGRASPDPSGRCGAHSGGRSAARPRSPRLKPHGRASPDWQWPTPRSRCRRTGPARDIPPPYADRQWPAAPTPRYPRGESARFRIYPAASRKTPTRRSDTPPARRPDGAAPIGAPVPPPSAAHTAGRPAPTVRGSCRRHSTPVHGPPTWPPPSRHREKSAGYPYINCYM